MYSLFRKEIKTFLRLTDWLSRSVGFSVGNRFVSVGVSGNVQYSR